MSSFTVVHGPVRRGRMVVLESGRIAAPLPAAVALVGINGSGKSSLFMKLTDTLRHRSSGARITVAGRRATLAWAPQTPVLPPWLAAASIARVHGLEFDELVAAMPALHLAETAGRRAGSLSLGQRQVLSIALALGRGADVTLLDEPFSALDFRRRVGALELLHEWRARHADRALVLSSQAAADLAEVCDRFVVIRDGRYVFNGARDQLGGDGSLRAVEQGLLRLLT